MKFQQKKESWSITISCRISIGMFENVLRLPITGASEAISLSERLDWLSMHSIKDRIMINPERIMKILICGPFISLHPMKGCSMFKFDQIGTQCEDRVQTEVCKSFCSGDFCNKGGISSGDESRPPIMCHQCLEIRDHMGDVIPNQPRNDENCHELVNNDYLG